MDRTASGSTAGSGTTTELDNEGLFTDTVQERERELLQTHKTTQVSKIIIPLISRHMNTLVKVICQDRPCETGFPACPHRRWESDWTEGLHKARPSAILPGYLGFGIHPRTYRPSWVRS
jgi:hypothetical protein